MIINILSCLFSNDFFFRLEEEEKFQSSLSDFQKREKERRQRALEEEKEKMESANMGIEQLRKVKYCY